MSDNLWPTDFGTIGEKTPVSILREQGGALGARTGNTVLGRVVTGGATPGKFQQVFSIYCPPLSYQMKLFEVDHDIALYPANIFVDGIPDPFIANNPDEFTAHLKAIFSLDKTKKIIASLIAQSLP